MMGTKSAQHISAGAAAALVCSGDGPRESQVTRRRTSVTDWFASSGPECVERRLVAVVPPHIGDEPVLQPDELASRDV